MSSWWLTPGRAPPRRRAPTPTSPPRGPRRSSLGIAWARPTVWPAYLLSWARLGKGSGHLLECMSDLDVARDAAHSEVNPRVMARRPRAVLEGDVRAHRARHRLDIDLEVHTRGDTNRHVT